jgi:O-antigen ligase
MKPSRSAPPPRPAPGGPISTWLVRVALVLTVLVIVPGADEIFELPKAEALRVCGLACLAFAVGSGWPRWNALSFADGAVLAWLGVETLATVFSLDPIRSVLGVGLQREGLVTSFALVGIFGAARAGARGLRDAVGTLDLALAAIGVASALAVLQALGLDPLPWRNTAVYAGGLRPFATLGHPNQLGVVTAAATAGSVALLGRGAPRRSFHAAIALLAATATVLTLSRAAWLGAFAGVAVVALSRALRRDALRVSGRGWLLAAAGLAVAIALVALAGWGGPLLVRLGDLARPGGGSGASRLEIWRTALAIGASRPVLGTGPATFDLLFPRFQTVEYWRHEWGGQPVHAHSIVLHAFATRGALGLLAGAGWLAMLALALRSGGGPAMRDARKAGGEVALTVALVAIAVAIGVSGGFGALGIAGATLLVAVSGLLVGLRAAPAPVAARGRDRAARTAALVVGALALIGSGLEIRASLLAREARSTTIGREASAAAARSAFTLRPFDDAYARLLCEATFGLAVAGPGSPAALRESEAAGRRAVALSPRRALNHEQLAGLLAWRAERGDPDAAREAAAEYARALELAPRSAFVMMETAQFLSLIGHQPDAIEMAGRASSLYPSEALPHSIAAAAALAAGDTARARAEAETALPLEWRDQAAARSAAVGLLEDLASTEAGRGTASTAPGLKHP